MNDIEQEILSRLLIELFLASPRRKTQLNEQDSRKDIPEKASTITKSVRKQRPGGKNR